MQYWPWEVEAGKEYYLHAHMNWEDDERAKDFSVVAQGEGGGAITITHWKGLESKQLPVIVR